MVELAWNLGLSDLRALDHKRFGKRTLTSGSYVTFGELCHFSGQQLNFVCKTQPALARTQHIRTSLLEPSGMSAVSVGQNREQRLGTHSLGPERLWPQRPLLWHFKEGDGAGGCVARVWGKRQKPGTLCCPSPTFPHPRHLASWGLPTPGTPAWPGSCGLNFSPQRVRRRGLDTPHFFNFWK